MIAGIIAAVVAAIAAITGAALNASSVKKTNETNLQLYQQQVKDQRQMWQETNNYNSAASQVARLSEAGINPMLAANTGNTASNQQLPSLPRMEAPQWGAAMQGVETGVDEYAAFIQQMQQINESKEREKYYKAQASLANSKEAFNVLRNTAYKAGDYFGNYVAREREKLSQALIGTSLANLKLDFMESTQAWRKKAVELGNSLTQSSIDLNKARKDLTKSQQTGQDWNNKYLRQTHDDRVNTTRRKLDILNYNFNNLLPAEYQLKQSQRDYYNARQMYTTRKYHWLPIEVLLKSGGELPKYLLKFLK